MEAPRIVSQFMPSLLHLAMVKTAFQLFNSFDDKTLDIVFIENQDGNLEKNNEGSQENSEVSHAKKKLLLIPPRLRHEVMEAVMGLRCSVCHWLMEHYLVIRLKKEDEIFYLRYDGTIDRTKTAQQLVLNSNIDIRQRFDLACMYCLEESVHALWAEMEATGKTENIETDDNVMTRFWTRWIREGCRVPWLQAVQDFLELPSSVDRDTPVPRFSSFFPLLQPKDRTKFLTSLKWAKSDDFRFCLYSATKEEEEQIVKSRVGKLLSLYLDWPLQKYFLEMAEKLWEYIDSAAFKEVLKAVWYGSICLKKKDFDYYKLVMDFFNKSSDSLRKSVEKDPWMSSTLESISKRNWGFMNIDVVDFCETLRSGRL